MDKEQNALSEVVGTILIVVLVIAVALIMASLFLGYFNLLGKSAYIAPEVKVVNVSGVQAISLYSRGGDVASLNTSAQAAYQLGLYVDTPESSDKVTYAPGLTYFGPGGTLYIYRTPGGYVATDNLSGITGTLPLPSGPLSLRLVDETAHILIANEGIGGTGTGTGTVTPTGTVTGTTTATTTMTTTVTTTATTSPTPTTCVVGSSWIIRNPDSTTLNYVLRDGTTIISSGTIPANTDLTIWYGGFPNNVDLYRVGNPNKLSTTGSGGNNNRWCQFASSQSSPSTANNINVDHNLNPNPPP